MPRKALLLTVGLLLAATLGGPSPARGQEANPATRYRQFLMNGLRAHWGAVGAIVRGDVGYPGHLVEHARAVEAIARLSADAFPEGSGGEGSRSKPEIWAPGSDFAERVAEFQSAASSLLAAAEAGDAEAIATAARAVGDGCRTCHDAFRAPAN